MPKQGSNTRLVLVGDLGCVLLQPMGPAGLGGNGVTLGFDFFTYVFVVF